MTDSQCKGVTRSGSRCKIVRNLVNGYCSYHQSQAVEQAKDDGALAASPPANIGDAQCSSEDTYQPCLQPVPKSSRRQAVFAVAIIMLAIFLAMLGKPSRKRAR